MGGKQMEIFVCKYGSPFGKITIAGNEKGLTGLWFDGQKYFGAGLPKDCAEKELPVFEKTKQWLDIYFTEHVRILCCLFNFWQVRSDRRCGTFC